MSSLINPRKFHAAVRAMRSFFEQKGFVEVHTQNALSILAACEDPKTVTKYNYRGDVWPLPQTGQMWLEDVLLNNPDIMGATPFQQVIETNRILSLDATNISFPCLNSSQRGVKKK